jgi:hypothetical protein
MTSLRRLSTRTDLVVALLLGCASLLLYVKTLAPTLLMADAAEFQLACYTLGIAHPTGYPLYLILGWLWSHLVPLGDAAYRVNLLSAAFAASAVALAYPLVLQVLRGAFRVPQQTLLRAAAIVATITLAVSRTFWSQALRAEVYALNSLFVVATLLLLLQWAHSRSSRTLQAAALVCGLSLTHHVTMALFLPAILIFVWLTDRSVFRSPRVTGTLLLLVALPQALYLYIPWRAPLTPYLYVHLAPGRTLELYENTPRGFFGFLTAEMFRGELGHQAPVLERLSLAATQLLIQFGLAGVTLGVLGVVKLAVPWAGQLSRRLLALLGLCYAALVGFTLFYHIGDIEVLYTPSYIIFAVCFAVGTAWLLEVTRTRRFGAYVVVGLCALLPAMSLWYTYPKVDRSADYQARAWAEGILSQPLPEGAILVSNDRNEITPLLYLQQVEGVRPDLLTMFPLMLPGEEYSNVVRVIEGVLDVDRPLFLLKPMPGLEVKYHLEPAGELVQVTGPAVVGEPEHPTDLHLADSLMLVGYDLEAVESSEGKALHVSLYWRVEQDLAHDYHTYVHLLDERGEAIAQSDHRPGLEYYPSSLWRPRETLLDVHVLPISASEDVDAVTLVAGAYDYPSLTPLGSALTLHQVQVTHQPYHIRAATRDGSQRIALQNCWQRNQVVAAILIGPDVRPGLLLVPHADGSAATRWHHFTANAVLPVQSRNLLGHGPRWRQSLVTRAYYSLMSNGEP